MAAEYRRVLEEEAEVVVHAVDRLCREGTLAMEAKVLENAAWLLYVERKLRWVPRCWCAIPCYISIHTSRAACVYPRQRTLYVFMRPSRSKGFRESFVGFCAKM